MNVLLYLYSAFWECVILWSLRPSLNAENNFHLQVPVFQSLFELYN